MSDPKKQYDIKGREIKAGDLLKVPHFTARRRQKIYMYKLVCRTDDRIKVTKDGQYLYAVDVCDIYRQGSLDKAHKCPLSAIGQCEIIDGGTVDDDDLFWERKRVKSHLDEIKQIEEPLTYNERVHCRQIAKLYHDNQDYLYTALCEEVGKDRVDLAIAYLREVAK